MTPQMTLHRIRFRDIQLRLDCWYYSNRYERTLHGKKVHDEQVRVLQGEHEGQIDEVHEEDLVDVEKTVNT